MRVLQPLLSSEQAVLTTHTVGARLQVHSKASLSEQEVRTVNLARYKICRYDKAKLCTSNSI